MEQIRSPEGMREAEQKPETCEERRKVPSSSSAIRYRMEWCFTIRESKEK
jgi:hypothetical protein